MLNKENWTGHLSDVRAAYCQYGSATAHCGQRNVISGSVEPIISQLIR